MLARYKKISSFGADFFVWANSMPMSPVGCHSNFYPEKNTGGIPPAGGVMSGYPLLATACATT